MYNRSMIFSQSLVITLIKNCLSLEFSESYLLETVKDKMITVENTSAAGYDSLY